jgi:hypothetical protein
MMGLPVTNVKNQNLGRVSDFILGYEARVLYLVITLKEESNTGEKLYAVPWLVSQPQVRKDKLIVAISQEQLKNAPQLANWTDLEVGDYKSKIHSYYGEDQEMQDRYDWQIKLEKALGKVPQ